MSMSEFTRNDAEEYGFSSAVIATLGVSALPGVGPATVRHIGDPERISVLFAGEDIESFTSALNATGAKFSAESAGISGWRSLRERIWHSGLSMAAELISHGVRCITPSSALYPTRFNDLGTRRPNWLFVRGDAFLLGAQSVTVVGTREPTDSGEFLTKYAVSLCREFDLPVVSGLAKGIDSTAHEWSLKLHLPTISVLGSGLLVPYPARNVGLADRIVSEGGLLISEYLPRQQPSADMFVWRNRLQACIGACLVASEWKRSSGTAHTVRFANELGRTSISLSLNGNSDSVEAGRGSRHFVLPSEHAEFVEVFANTRQKLDNFNGVAESSITTKQLAAPVSGKQELPPENDNNLQASLF